MRRFPFLLTGLALVGCGTDVGGPGSTMLSCVFREPTALQVGEVLQVEGAGSEGVCLRAGADDGEFVYIPFFATAPSADGETDVSLGVQLMVGGAKPRPEATAALAAVESFALQSADGHAPGLPTTADGRLPGMDHGFHERLRLREIAELEPRIRAAAAPPLRETRAPQPLPAVGDLLEYNVSASCSERDVRAGRVRVISERAIVVADTQNPTGFSNQDYASFAAAFDTLVYPLGIRHFGAPTDIDGNGRIIIFFTVAVNQISSPGGATVTTGFFWSGDLFPTQSTGRLEACANANQAEMFYMMVPDPLARFGPPANVESLREMAILVMGHEFQHLVNAARRLHVNNAAAFERPWLNEGLSHVAEELLFYQTSGLPRGANLTVEMIQQAQRGVFSFNRYMSGNIRNLARFLQRPDTVSVMGPDNLATRGATWSFLRYALDRTGRGDETVLHGLVNARNAGLDNLDAALGGRALEWMQDWSVALYADDLFPGVDPRYRHPSWHFRDIFYGLQNSTGYPLQPVPLTPRSPHTVRLQPGAGSFTTFSVDRDGRAAVHVEANGRRAPRTLGGAFIRAR
jgi:hypothetical protein